MNFDGNFELTKYKIQILKLTLDSSAKNIKAKSSYEWRKVLLNHFSIGIRITKNDLKIKLVNNKMRTSQADAKDVGRRGRLLKANCSS